MLPHESAMEERMYHCDLCRLPVEVDEFHLQTKQGLKRFCCEGCLGIYRMLHEEEIVMEPPPNGG